MKLSQLILALSVSISGAAFAADNHGHDLKPMHGGAVAEAKEVEYEFVASADKLQLYMRDHGKPVAVTGMTAKVTLLAGSDKQDVAGADVTVQVGRRVADDEVDGARVGVDRGRHEGRQVGCLRPLHAEVVHEGWLGGSPSQRLQK